MRKKNILFPFDGTSLGGSHLCALKIIDGLKKSKEFNPIVIIEKKGILTEILKKKKIKIRSLNSEHYQSDKSVFMNLYYFLRYFYRRIKFLNKNDVNLIHTNEYRILNTWAIISFIKKIKIIHHCRSPYKKSLFLKINLKLSDNLIVISNHVKESLKKKKINKSVKLIYDSFDLIKKKIKKKNNNKIKKIGFFGNYKSIKRPLIFFKICEKLLNDSPNYQFVYVGEINNMEKKKIEKDFPVVFSKLKIINYTFEPKKIIEKLDLLICPSVDEGFGRLPVEAASLGVLTLVSNNSGHKDYIDKGFCVKCKVDDVDDFYKNAKIYINFKKNNLIKKNVDKFILSSLLEKKNLLQIKNVYKKLIF